MHLAAFCFTERCCQVVSICSFDKHIWKANSVLGTGRRWRSTEKEGEKAEVSQIWSLVNNFKELIDLKRR